MKKETVWVSSALSNTALNTSFENEFAKTDPQKYLSCFKKNIKGMPLTADCFPAAFWGEYPDKTYKKPPHFSLPGGNPIVSDEVKQVMQQFDLGQTSFYPTTLYKHDRKTPVEGSYYCINFGETKTCCMPEESQRTKKFDALFWTIKQFAEDGDVAVNASALQGVDLWVDTRIRKSLFFSDRLARALKAAKLTRTFGLRKCRVVAEYAGG
jgi:hypothetical protein